MDHGARTRLLTAVVLAVVFSSGVLLGYAADSNPLVPEPGVATAAEADGERTREPRTRRYVYERLDRTPDQDAAIEEIIRSHRHLMNQLHRDFDGAQAAYSADFNALVVETREAIALVFPPDQQAEYRNLLAEFYQRRDEDRVARDSHK
jgi:Spy/CpxP family protein refolding chaperone